MSTVSAVALPEPGQVVEVRGSMWAVSHVREQGLMRSPADEAVAGKSHVVELQSLDEDRLGEQLQVIWELEVGQSLSPAQGLPERISVDGFDAPSKLAGFIDALRWGAVTSARSDRFQAPFWSGAKVEAYQLEPLRRALGAPRANLLLADDVGLGKTIEAGLVIQELLLRHRARSVVIVCPPSLSLKWQDEMREKFGLDFVIINSERMAEVRRSHGLHANPFTIFPRVIVSMAWLSSNRAQRMLRDVYQAADSGQQVGRYAFDILVVDEAHHVAPSKPTSSAGGRSYAVDSLRTVATRELAEHCEHRLFLSATPHNGHSESFTALLEMIDPRRFARGAELGKDALKDVTVRRLKTELDGLGFKKRRVEQIPFEPTADEQEMFALLERIVGSSGRNKGDVVSLLLKKRFFSSPLAFGRSVENFLAADTRCADSDWDEWDDYDEVLGEDSSDEEEGYSEQPEAEALRGLKDEHVLASASFDDLERLSSWGLGQENTPDSRAKKLLSLLDGICRPDGSWSNERVVVFTEYADTLEWLKNILVAHGYEDRLSLIQGSTSAEDRELIRARFNADPQSEPVRVLLATDAAGEGIDLQTYCHRLVNFDIPFNPSRLEQRIGRIDRYGQKMEPIVYHFAPVATSSTYHSDMEFLQRIAEKIARVEIDLGSANQLVDEQIQKHFAPNLRSSKGTKKKSSDNDVIAQVLAGGVELNRQLTKLESDFDETRIKMHLEPENLRRVVDTALELNNQQKLVPNFDLRDADTPDVEVFDIPDLTAGWLPALKGLEHRLHPEIRRPITFDPEFATGRDDVVFVHLGHPLVQKAQRLLRSTLWSSDSSLNRVTAVEVEGLAESVALAVVRMALVGKGGVRLHEDVFLAGVRLTGAKTQVAEQKTIDALEQALDAERLELAGESVRSFISELWASDQSPVQERLQDSVERRAQARTAEVEGQLLKRRDADVDRVRKIFTAFRRNLQSSLNKVKAELAELEAGLFVLDQDQARQFRKDVRAMESRLLTLETEEEREVEAVSVRYEDVRPHVMSAALVFAVSADDAKVWGK